MLLYTGVLQGMRRFFPVIHCVDEKTARTAIGVAQAAGADGVFLIDQGNLSTQEVGDLARRIADEVTLKVGVNLLNQGADDVAPVIYGSRISMWWADDGLARGALRSVGPTLHGVSVADMLSTTEFFGGIAFKYQRAVAPEQFLDQVILSRGYHVNVVTTSGPGTGEPATLAKVEAMAGHVRLMNKTLHHEAPQRLALASGISLANIDGYLPFVDDFLVGSSIETSFGVFDAGRVQELSDRIHGGG